jgi:hypothetical protein
MAARLFDGIDINRLNLKPNGPSTLEAVSS